MKKIENRLIWFWANVDKSSDDDACWPWLKSRNAYGYGTLRIGKITMLAHRYAYELSRGAISRGLEIIHSCDNPACCNPRHLRQGSHSENMQDAVARKRDARVKKTHCVNGHPFNAENTRVVYGPRNQPWRHCRVCGRENMRRYRSAKAAPLFQTQ